MLIPTFTTHKLSKNTSDTVRQIIYLERMILHAIYRYRVLVPAQIANLFGLSLEEAQAILTSLGMSSYLKPLERIAYIGEAPKPVAYRLGVLGAKVVMADTGTQASEFYYWGQRDDRRRTKTKITAHYLDHLVGLASLRIAFERSALTNNFTLTRWDDDITIWRSAKPRVIVTNNNGTTAILPVVPDGFFVLEAPQGRAYFCLEFDCSTESASRFGREKVQAYKEFVLTGMFHTHYEVSSSVTPVRILTVAPATRRASNLKTVAERYGEPEASSMFHCTSLPELLSSDVFTAPIWLRGNAAEAVALASPIRV